jgi:HSP20 family protein
MISTTTFKDRNATHEHSLDPIAWSAAEADIMICAAQPVTVNRTPQPSNLLETWGSYVLQVALPGADLNALHIEVLYRRVNIDGKCLIPQGGTGTFLRHGIHDGKLHETFDMPAEVDGNRAEATYNCGILTLTLPKVSHLMPASIHVQVAD